jgi:hypothetical protein
MRRNRAPRENGKSEGRPDPNVCFWHFWSISSIFWGSADLWEGQNARYREKVKNGIYGAINDANVQLAIEYNSIYKGYMRWHTGMGCANVQRGWQYFFEILIF